ncbi:MAG: type II toxin-antitoxin system prevent-host-death family antitoxin [Victivallaceae bacterium]|nr:type II toxin-antitoxin system prevent-host-death family antitoxin [Victivallaceae bacterium]
MEAINYTTARKELAKTMERVCEDSNPVIITKSRNCAVVMISLADYNAMEETDYLLRSPANAARLRRAVRAIERAEGKKMTMREFEEACDAKSAVCR